MSHPHLGLLLVAPRTSKRVSHIPVTTAARHTDVTPVDGDLANRLSFLASMSLSMIAKLAAVVLFAPAFLLPAVAVAALGGWLGNVYIKAQLSVKREMSNAKSPVLAILGGAMAGLCGSLSSTLAMRALIPIV